MASDGSEANNSRWNNSETGNETSNYCVALCTTPPADAERIAKALVEERLAACVNITNIKSCYIWNGKLDLEAEALLIIKTENRMLERLMAKIRELHSYEVPEIIVLPIIKGYQPYLDWIAGSVG